MKISFFIKKHDLLKNGKAPIVLRITMNGVNQEIRINRSIELELWNQAKGCSNGRNRTSNELNYCLESIRLRFYELQQDSIFSGNVLIWLDPIDPPVRFV